MPDPTGTPRRDDLLRAIRDAAPITRPAAERITDAVLDWSGPLATLRTLDDVAAVCEAAGLTEIPMPTSGPGASRRWTGHGLQIDADHRGWTYGPGQDPWPQFPAPAADLYAAIEAARTAGGAPESQRRTPGPETVGDPATPKPQVADLSRDDRTDLIAAAIENACECAAIDVTVTEDDGTQAPLRRLARCLDGAGLIDWAGL